MDNTQQESVQLILARLASRWRSVADDIARITGTLRDAIGASWAGLGNDVESHIDTLRDAVGIFEAAALEPEVVIATTGTTSSGKSTLANMLIGDALLPKAVQEMSAGVVIVRHDDARRGQTPPNGVERRRQLVHRQARGRTGADSRTGTVDRTRSACAESLELPQARTNPMCRQCR